MPTFFIIIIALYLLGNLYIFTWGKNTLKAQSTGVKVLLSIIFWGCALSFFSSFLLRNVAMPDFLAHTMQEIGNGWLVFTLYMVILLGICDLLRLFHIRVRGAFYLAIGLTLSLLGYGYYNYQHPDIKVINIIINKPVNSEEKQLKVVTVSDIHLGYATDKDMLQKYVKLINDQKPDLILIGGDLIDNSVVPLYSEQMHEELSRLNAPYGIYMVPGNHEYISGITESKAFVQTTPIVFLQDSIVTLPNGIQIAGRDDRHNKNRKPIEELIHTTNPTKPVLLLDHQPYELDKTASTNVDLQFSGHTHRGQIWPMNLVTDHLFELSYGYKQIKNTHFYVSSGLSLWGPPFRIGTDSELVVFNITFK
ncbi:metallophosphoesterase [Parabacteroides chinchillae]|uniref:Calcineurin-like phosphoesterase domain-containing protein n=1 Tax=Parabacteroides chinchillae TaxID=871327 RepID=A0A8G2BVG7_9BACT|nr:metallophosphoesterase [Parabacteroides chinchillae]SEF64487.1 hypothetical protein SAMN05444001_10417 [Parabacteroides chinchillae]